MVGAGSCQLSAIRRIQELGYEVVAADYNTWTEGKQLADFHVLADTFDDVAMLKAAKKYAVDGIMTTGTDQPVLVVAKTVEALGLPGFIGTETALLVTNKKFMKRKFLEHGIATAKFALVKKDFKPAELEGMTPPYVVKPVDSQGQRGIFKIHGIQEIRDCFDEVRRHSRSDEILVEEYYKNEEITLSGWVTQGKANILTVTDRVSFPSDSHIGVCIAHDHPSKHLPRYKDEIVALTLKICRIFGISEGPIYFQFLVGDKGILVNEIACRLGGAYEDITIPMATGIDVLKLNIEGSINSDYDRTWAEKYRFEPEKVCFTTQLFFCKTGIIATMTPIKALKELPFVVDAGYNVHVGDCVKTIENAAQRAGFVVLTGKNPGALKENLRLLAEVLRIENRQGENLVYTLG